MLHFSAVKSFQWLRFSSSSSPQVTEETVQSGIGLENKADTEAIASANDGANHSEAPVSDGKAESGVPVESVSEMSETSKRWRKHSKRIAFSDSDMEPDLSRDGLVKLLTEKEQLLFLKQEELEKMKDKVLMTFAEMENVSLKCKETRHSEFCKKPFGLLGRCYP